MVVRPTGKRIQPRLLPALRRTKLHSQKVLMNKRGATCSNLDWLNRDAFVLTRST